MYYTSADLVLLYHDNDAFLMLIDLVLVSYYMDDYNHSIRQVC